jgi:hypothetical protein
MWSLVNRLSLSVVALSVICLCQEASTPWRQNQLIEPSALAAALKSGDAPILLCVGPSVLYRSKHITHAIYAGPGDKAEGISLLKAAASAIPKDENVVIYCGCCPMEKCPNIRPAYEALKALGFTKVRVLDVATNMKTNWFDRGYPAESGERP